MGNDPATTGDRPDRLVPYSLVVKAISEEPELPGSIPDCMWDAIRNDRGATEYCLKTTVKETKDGIKERLDELLSLHSDAPAPREVHQAPGPHRPKRGVLASMLDWLPAHYQIEEVVINGQTGRVLIVCWDGVETVYKQFSTRGRR